MKLTNAFLTYFPKSFNLKETKNGSVYVSGWFWTWNEKISLDLWVQTWCLVGTHGLHTNDGSTSWQPPPLIHSHNSSVSSLGLRRAAVVPPSWVWLWWNRNKSALYYDYVLINNSRQSLEDISAYWWPPWKNTEGDQTVRAFLVTQDSSTYQVGGDSSLFETIRLP